ncbi:hypothetical protein JR334_07120 [Clostridia bacterium]|nr:hypothetical protein JR334_07120 [Clostridia bacterium]
MGIFKSVGEKAKGAASAAASKSQEMVEVGKLKKKISNLEDLIGDSKMKIGELTYAAHVEGQELPISEMDKIYSEIDQSIKEIETLKVDIQNVKSGTVIE